MTTFVIFGNPNDGDLWSGSNTYSTAQSGGSLDIDYSTGQMAAGQERGTLTTYYIVYSLLEFATGVLDGLTVSSATLALTAADVGYNKVTHTQRLYAHDWGGTIETSDWVNPTSFANADILAYLSSSGLAAETRYDFTSNTAFVSAVNTTGPTRLLVTNNNAVAGTAPSDDEEVYWYRSDSSGTTKDPRLTVIASDVTNPTVVSVGTEAKGSNATVTPTLPGDVADNDILVCFVAYRSGTPSLTQDYTKKATHTNGAANLDVWWKRVSGSQTAPAVSGCTESVIAQLISVRGAITSGDPFEAYSSTAATGTDTTEEAPSLTTTSANALVIGAISTADDNGHNITATGNMDSIAMLSYTQNTSGSDNSLCVWSGRRATAGAIGSVVVTQVVNGADAWTHVAGAITPASTGPKYQTVTASGTPSSLAPVRTANLIRLATATNAALSITSLVKRITSATSTATPTTRRTTAHVASGFSSATPTALRSARHAVSTSSTAAPATQRMTGHAANANSSAVSASLHKPLLTRLATSSASVSLKRSLSIAVAAAASAAASLARAIGIGRSAASSAVASAVRRTSPTRAASSSSTTSTTRSTQRTQSAAASPTASTLRGTSRSLLASAAAVSSAAAQRVTLVAVTAVSNVSGAVQRRTALVLASASSATAALRRLVLRTHSASSSADPQATRSTLLTRAAASSAAAITTARQLVGVVLVAVAVASATLARRSARSLSTAPSAMATLLRRSYATRIAASTASASAVRRPRLSRLSVSTANSAAIRLSRLTVVATAHAAGELSRRVVRSLSAAASAMSTLARRMHLTRQVAATPIAAHGTTRIVGVMASAGAETSLSRSTRKTHGASAETLALLLIGGGYVSYVHRTHIIGLGGAFRG